MFRAESLRGQNNCDIVLYFSDFGNIPLVVYIDSNEFQQCELRRDRHSQAPNRRLVTKRESFSEDESAREAFKKAARKRQGKTCCTE